MVRALGSWHWRGKKTHEPTTRPGSFLSSADLIFCKATLAERLPFEDGPLDVVQNHLMPHDFPNKAKSYTPEGK